MTNHLCALPADLPWALDRRIECWACLRQRRPPVCPRRPDSMSCRRRFFACQTSITRRTSVLNNLSSPRSRRNYKFAMDQFIDWYCSEPRLALNRTVVLRFRLHLESLALTAGTINQRLAAVRRLAYEAADSSLLSTELAAGKAGQRRQATRMPCG
jgi:hypothetical protein